MTLSRVFELKDPRIGQSVKLGRLGGKCCKPVGLFFIVSLLFLTERAALGATINAASPSATDVQAAINTANSGDTVIIPAGSATWSSTITVSGITLIGGGGTGGTTTITEGSSAGPILSVNAVAGHSTTVENFTWIEQNASARLMTFSCSSNAFWRFCSNNVSCNNGLWIYNSGEGSGLVDNNNFTFGTGDTWNIWGPQNNAQVCGSGGDYIGNWAYGVNYGATNYVYVEHNSVTSTDTGASRPDGPLEGYQSAKFVVRYNTFTNCGIGGWHGTDSGGLISPHSYEIYGNYCWYTAAVPQWDVCFDSRGGTGLVYSNTIAGVAGHLPYNGFKMWNVRADGSCSGNCGFWGNSTGTPYDGTGSSPYTGYPSAQCQGYTGPVGGYITTCSGSSSTEVLSPTYIWGNTEAGGPMPISSDGALIVLNQDYYTSSPTYSNGTFSNFPGSPGMSYTPLAYPYPLGGGTQPPGTNPPQITAQPANASVTVGQSAAFNVVASGSGTLTYQWYWYGTNVPGAASSSWTTPPTVIGNSNSAVYVTVRNAYGSVTSVVATLTVTASTQTVHYYYVAPNGNDSTGNGSIGSPWATVNFATSKMSGGDVLYIRGGTYSQIFDIYGPSGSASYPTTVAAYPGETPIFNHNNITGSAHSLDGLNWFTMSGLTIMSNNIGMIVGAAGACTNIILTNMVFADIGQQGFQIEHNSYNVSLINSVVHDTGLWIYNGEGLYIGEGDSSGILDNTHDVTIQGCTIYNTSDEGIELKGGTYNMTVQSNIIYSVNLAQNSYGAGGGAIEVDEEGTYNYWPSNPNQVVRGNTVYNTVIGIRGGTGGKYYNNVVYGCSSSGMLINNGAGQSANSTYPRLFYNNTVDNSPGIVYSSGANSILNNIGYSGAYNLADSPAYFVNAAAHNYHLILGGLPIGAGTNLFSVVATDFDGNARPNSGAFDIGAYQYGAAGALLPPTNLHIVSSQ
jgi:hypothetical protein